MRRAITAAVGLAVIALCAMLAPSAAAADDKELKCAGASIPEDATVGSDRNGDRILISSNGGVIRCDGTSRSAEPTPENMGVEPEETDVAGIQSPPTSAPSAISGWTMTQQTFVDGSNGDLVGYLGANEDQTVVFWRSYAGGPIETWTRTAVAGTQSPPSSAPSAISGWTMAQETFIDRSNGDLVGYLGANEDQTVVFWRSYAGGPIETWIRPD